ncbi:hypothetical protein [Hydrogenophaga sp.]|uniref:hypothetical protein n=1 Tax=Hydrogenophaga sp. TaxID=1904254 RepID=UPI003F6E6B5E
MSAVPHEASLPAGFEDLQPRVGDWALPTEQARYSKRLGTSMEEIRDFYDAIFPRMDAILQHLQTYPANDIAALPPDTRRLYRLALAYFEASHPVELNWRGPDLDDAFPAQRIEYQGPSRVEN